jgi:Cd2+/Zn2+-exporting ATPase
MMGFVDRLHSENEVVECAAAMEARSDHPIAEAIVRCARKRRIESAPVEGLQNP